MSDSGALSRTCLAFAAAGVALHAYTALFKSEFAGEPSLHVFGLGLWAWSLAPYAAGLSVSRGFGLHAQAMGWLIAVLAMDLVMHWSVFVEPQGSTAALGLLFMPLWNLIIVGPAGALLGWLVQRAHRARSR